MSENKPLCDTASGGTPCETSADNGPWLELTYGVLEIVPALRSLSFPEAFVEKAVLALIENNPIDSTREVFQWTPTAEQLRQSTDTMT